MPTQPSATSKLKSHAARRALLGGTALCGAAVLMISGPAVAATTLPTQGGANLANAGSGTLATKVLSGGSVTASTAGYSSDGTTATVNVSGHPKTLIDWSSFNVASGKTLNFSFNQSGDLVVNRVSGGSITVVGAVNGKVGSSTGGNIWFLASNGVFINGTVSASGVMASNNTSLSDQALLTDSLSQARTALVAAGGSLIDLEGSAVASSVSINADGSISLGASTTQASGVTFDSEGDNAAVTLGGNVNAGSNGTISLISKGAISQTAGTLTASTLSASSIGGLSLPKANQVATVSSLSNSVYGDVTYNSAYAAGVTITSVANPVGDATLTSSSGDIAIGSGGVNDDSGGQITVNSAGAVTLGGTLSSSSATLVANSGSITQTGGHISAASLDATSDGDLILNQQNLVPDVELLKNVGTSGDITYVSGETTPTTLTTATNASGGISISAGGDLDLLTDNAVHIVSSNNDLTLSAGGALDIGDAARVSVGRNLSLTGASFPDDTLNVASANTYTLHDTASSGGLTLGTVSAPGNVSVTLDNGDLTISSLAGTGGSATAIATSGGANITTASAGTNLTLTGKTASLGTGTASGDLAVTGTGGDVAVTNHATSNSGSVILSADGEVNVTGGISAHLDYSATGHSFSAAALSGPTIGQDLIIHDSDSANGLDLHAITLAASRNVMVTVDHGDLSLAGVVVNAGGATLTANAGTVEIGGNVTSSGTMSFGGPASLTADVTFQGSSVEFRSTLDGAHVATITGSAYFEGAVGGSTPLAGLSAIGPQVAVNGSISATGSVNLISTVQGMYVQHAISGNRVKIQSPGDIDISLGGSVTGLSTGTAVVIADDGSLVNDAGASALNTPNCRWLIYTQAPGTNGEAPYHDDFGGLSGKSWYGDIYDFTADKFPTAPGAGNRFVYGYQPTLTVTAATQSAQYTGAPIVDGYSVTGLINGDALADAVTASTKGMTTSGRDVGSYSVTPSGAKSGLNYAIAYQSGTVSITPKPLDVGLMGSVEKTYNGSTAARLTSANYSLIGVIGGDSVRLNDPGTGSYDTKDAGTGKTVEVDGLALLGPKAFDYTLNSTTVGGAIGKIDPRTVTAFLAGTVSRVYDSTTTATLKASNYRLSGLVSGDTVGLNDPTSGTYDTKDVGIGKTVSVSGLSLTGASAGDYVLASTSISGGIGTITAFTLKPKLVGPVTKFYDGTTAAYLTSSNYALAGVFAGDTVALNDPATGAYATPGSSTTTTTQVKVTVDGLAISGPDAKDYALAGTTVSGNVGMIRKH